MNIDCSVFIQEEVVFSHDRVFRLAKTPILNKVELYVVNKDEDVLLCKYDVCSHGYKERDITIPDKIRIGSKVRAYYKYEPDEFTTVVSESNGKITTAKVSITNTFNKKPPLGLKPFVFFVEERKNEIISAWARYRDAELDAPKEWLLEYEFLSDWVKYFKILEGSS